MWLFTQMLQDDRNSQKKSEVTDKANLWCVKNSRTIKDKELRDIVPSFKCFLDESTWSNIFQITSPEYLSINHEHTFPLMERAFGCLTVKIHPLWQYNNAVCRIRKKLEENFIRDLIVLEILALCNELCLLYPQHRPTTLLLSEKSAFYCVVPAPRRLLE